MKTKRIFFITFMILLKLSVSSQENNNIIYTVFDPDYNIYNTSCVEARKQATIFPAKLS